MADSYSFEAGWKAWIRTTILKTLQSLVDGVKGAGATADVKVKFLRRIPRDPMTNTYEWGMHSMQDDPKSDGWGGQNVFNVYTKSQDKAADGTPYAEW